MGTIQRLFVEKKGDFNIDAEKLLADLRENLGIKNLKNIRILNRYDISGIKKSEYTIAKSTIFSEPPVDHIFEETLESGDARVLAVEYLPGQYDQRADSAAQCIQIITLGTRPAIHNARVYIFEGNISREDYKKIKSYLINPVDSREAALDKPHSLSMKYPQPSSVQILDRFTHQSPTELHQLHHDLALAMSMEDLAFCQKYFRDDEQRDPSLTEIKLLDTYWSDHCRHTTFHTIIEGIQIEDSTLTTPHHGALAIFSQMNQRLYPPERQEASLMKLATLSMKELLKSGEMTDMEISGEVNACSIIRPVKINGRDEEWIIMFKNETHNHPTEIEPFGGAATCLGGAIRDPLSGRAYVYQAMRVTGSGDPRLPIEQTLPGKLPQRKITTEAAHGYSSYGNQIGLATGLVHEFYHPGYIAKRMEVGAVVGAVARKNILREEPVPGDIILLVGGKTGRDGIGGATGSSKEHTEESIVTAGAEVQKGNPPEERKLQRLFRRPEVCRLIKRSNDFGAGGVSVAIGELADGLDIKLDSVPKKYEGLDGTELALSESQERMAVVVDAGSVEQFKSYASAENLEAVEIARVISDKRLKMVWRGEPIVDVSRDFLNTNGVRQKTKIRIQAPSEEENYFSQYPRIRNGDRKTLKEMWFNNLADLNVANQKGLIERFDSTIGAGSVLLPFGGLYQRSPSQTMVAKIPVLGEDTSTGTVMSFGFNPHLSSWSPFHGAVFAVVDAIAKIVATGGDYTTVRLSLQEYFEKLGNDEIRWGKPFSALLGAYYILHQLRIAAIGGKDSMSGSFNQLDVPPTLIAFAITTISVDKTVSTDFKRAGSHVVYLQLPRDSHEMPDFDRLKINYAHIHKLIQQGKILASHTVGYGGVAAAITKMSMGNRLGFTFKPQSEWSSLFAPEYGSILLEIEGQEEASVLFKGIDYQLIGHTQSEPAITIEGIEIDLDEAYKHWTQPLEGVFPTRCKQPDTPPLVIPTTKGSIRHSTVTIAKPRVIIPAFPGTNCEYDTEEAFSKAGAIAETIIFRNLNPQAITESLHLMRDKISNAQIIALPGGFSSGDEPDGSGKFIAAVFRNPAISDAVMELLKQRDGLIVGICNGFQALVKLGLLPHGEIRQIEENDPTLTFNTIGRHVAKMIRTKIVSTLSPWFLLSRPGDIHSVAISHGEGRFVATPQVMEQLIKGGQVATQYVDLESRPTYDSEFNPNGSWQAVEGITCQEGRILGKMGHSERITSQVAFNVPGNKDQKLFQSGVAYYS